MAGTGNEKRKTTEDIAVETDDKGNDIEVTMMQKWPVRKPRPYIESIFTLPSSEALNIFTLPDMTT